MNSLLASILGYVNGFFALMIIAVSVAVGFSLENELGPFAPWVGLIIGLLIAAVLCGFLAIMVSMRNELVHIRRILNDTNIMNNSGNLETEKNTQSIIKPHEEYWNDGSLKEKGTYKDGKKDGVWEIYDAPGQLYRKGSYTDGKRDGVWESYYHNGELMDMGTYINDKLDGVWERYHKNGKLEEKRTYKDGEIIKEEKF